MYARCQICAKTWADIACLPGFDKQEFRAKFPGLSADEENLAWTKYISDMVFALRAECEKTPILMAHYTVPGCNMESGQTSFFTNFEPVIPREALMAARYEAVLLGHIHRPQIIEGLDKVSNAPKTGDSTNIWLPILLLVISTGGMAGLYIRKKKNRK